MDPLADVARHRLDDSGPAPLVGAGGTKAVRGGAEGLLRPVMVERAPLDRIVGVVRSRRVHAIAIVLAGVVAAWVLARPTPVGVSVPSSAGSEVSSVAGEGRAAGSASEHEATGTLGPRAEARRATVGGGDAPSGQRLERDGSARESAVGRLSDRPLRSLLPASVRRSCERDLTLDPEAQSAITCSPRGPLARVELRRYPTVRVLRARYRALVPSATRGGSGTALCVRGEEEERAWSRGEGESPVGRYACRHNADAAEIWWSDESARTLGLVLSDNADLEALFRWWLGADPTHRAG